MLKIIERLNRKAAGRQNSVTEAEIERYLETEQERLGDFIADAPYRAMVREIIGDRKARPFRALEGALLWLVSPRASLEALRKEKSLDVDGSRSTSGAMILAFGLTFFFLSAASLSENQMIIKVATVFLLCGLVGTAALFWWSISGLTKMESDDG